MARTQVHVRHAVKQALSSATSQRFRRRTTARPTINLCMKCNNLRQAERDEPEVSRQRWSIMVGEKSYRGILSACLGAQAFENKMWERCASLLNEAATALQLGKTCQKNRRTEKRWRCCGKVTVCVWQTMVRRAMQAGEENDWSEVLTSKGLNAWTRVKTQECYEVGQEDHCAVDSESPYILRRIIASVGHGGVTLSHVCFHCHSRSKTSGGYRGTACGRQCDWRNPNRVWFCTEQYGPQ